MNNQHKKTKTHKKKITIVAHISKLIKCSNVITSFFEMFGWVPTKYV